VSAPHALSHYECRRIPVDGGELYCESAGVGRPIVFLHAKLFDDRLFDPQFTTLASSRLRSL